MSEQSNNEKERTTKAFVPGNRHGRGRPAGSRNRATLLLDQLAEGEGEKILKNVLEQALSGDLKAAEILLARIWPVKKGRPVRLNLPPTDTPAGVADGLEALIRAVAAGAITPDEAGAVAALLDAKRKAIDLAAESLPRQGVSFNISFVTPGAGTPAELTTDAPDDRAIPGGNVAVLGPRKI